MNRGQVGCGSGGVARRRVWSGASSWDEDIVFAMRLDEVLLNSAFRRGLQWYILGVFYLGWVMVEMPRQPLVPRVLVVE